jgi:hypothetical protein
VFSSSNEEGDDLTKEREGGMNDQDRDPVDLAAVVADDRLLDEVAQGAQPQDQRDGGEELVKVLTGWRREIVAIPLWELVDVATAQASIRAGSRRGRRGFRQWVRSVLRSWRSR